MGKHVSNSGYVLTAVLGCLWTFWVPVTSAQVGEYQSAITKAFPGFQILSRSEFDPEIQETVKTNIALVSGLFNVNTCVGY